MRKIGWADSNFGPVSSKVYVSSSLTASTAHNIAEILEFSKVFRGRELTRKDARIPCGLPPIDDLLEGGIVRGRISEIIANPGAGKTSLAAAFAANVTRREAVAWIDTSDDFDPASVAAVGVELTRLLWVSSKGAQAETPTPQAGMLAPRTSRFYVVAASLKAAEWILAAGGFGLVILNFGANVSPLSQSAALRLSRAAEQSGAGVLMLALRRMCGTSAVLSLTLRRERACFSRLWPGAPALFDGLLLEACVTRNKLGRSGQTAKWGTVIEALSRAQHSRAHQRNEAEAVSRSPESSKGNESARCAYDKVSATRVFNEDSPLSAPKSSSPNRSRNPSASLRAGSVGEGPTGAGFPLLSGGNTVQSHRLKPASREWPTLRLTKPLPTLMEFSDVSRQTHSR